MIVSGQSLSGPGGTGDVVFGTLSGLSEGQTLDVCVNAGGGSALVGTVSQGGRGGGASGVALGTDFSNPVLIAAGGGGGGGGGVVMSGFTPWVTSGGSAGLPWADEGDDGSCGFGGVGGAQDEAGPGGAIYACVSNPPPSAAGSDGSGVSGAGPGAGGTSGTIIRSGGGGGGGYYGGGGGAGATFGNPSGVAAGGGGGSDYCAAVLSGCGVIGTNHVRRRHDC